MIDLRSVLISLDSPDLSVERRSGSYVNGIWTAAAPTVFTIKGSAQPAGENVELLPEGVRERDAIVIYTATELLTTRSPSNTGGIADRVLFGGRRYEVQNVDDWAVLSGQGMYYKAIATLVERD